jgi:hypothetical protein
MNSQPNRDAHRNNQMRWLRTATLLWGIAVFIWLAPEDDSVLPALLLGLVISVIIVVWLFIRLNTEVWQRGWRLLLTAAVSGALAGAGTSISATLLMLFKNARHAHLYPDYPPEILLDTLARLPLWSLAAVIIALGLVCCWWAFQK